MIFQKQSSISTHDVLFKESVSWKKLIYLIDGLQQQRQLKWTAFVNYSLTICILMLHKRTLLIEPSFIIPNHLKINISKKGNIDLFWSQ